MKISFAMSMGTVSNLANVNDKNRMCRVNLALGSIQCFILVSIAPESPDSKSGKYQVVTLGEIELLTF